VITLDVEGKRMTGTFESSEYGENAVREKFKGEVVPTPKACLTAHRLKRKACAGV
jgi:hypothetical protein